MVIVLNNTEKQTVFIPKLEGGSYTPPRRGDYEEGYADGMRDQKGKVRSINITENGTYTNPNGYSPIVVDVPQGGGCNLQEKSVEMQFSRVITVTPDEGFDGLSKVNVDAKKYGDIRYNEGANTQKAKLTDITIDKNGTYTNADGYKKVVVNVEDGGKIEGEKIVEIPTDYDWEDDYVDITPSEGYDGMSLVRVDGEDFARKVIADQEAKLTPTKEITSNGTYIAPYGFKRVIVNVPIIEKDHILSYETDDNSFIPIYYKDRSLEGEIVASLKGQVWFKGDVGDLRIFMGENNPTRNMTSVIVPESTAKLSYSFYNCNKLASIDLPSTMELFHITYPLSSLNTIICRATTAPTLVIPQGSAVAENGVLKVPSGSDYSSWLNTLPSGWAIQSIE